ncbi:MAG: TetR/AcrR family transcriptional regulator [Planctomycetes bacterium]|nr:TetR/AcrR family transcriptional regulator [Planctomycetota bacterium]
MDNDMRVKILDVASRLFLLYGYKNTTVNQIAVEVGIAKGSVYMYFDSKADIFGVASERVCREVLSAMAGAAASDKPVEEKLYRMSLEATLYIWDFCHQAPHSPELWSEVLAAAAKYAVPAYEESRKLFAKVIAEGQQSGLFGRDWDSDTAARLLQVAMQGFDPPYMLVESRQQIETELPMLVELFIRGLKAQDGAK